MFLNIYIDNPVTNLDPLYVLNSPKPLVKTLSKYLWTTLTATLSTYFETPVSVIQKLIPSGSPFDHYGQAHQLDGGDVIHAWELIPLQSDSQDTVRDKTFQMFVEVGLFLE